MAMEKTFEPAAIEAKWAAFWEAEGLFRPHRPDAVPYTIVNPPPNVTGALHIGHALDNTLQDVLIRYERLRGKDALWVVGMDHAGIATQMVVERQMAETQDKRTNYSRDEFVAKVWDWKATSGGQITGQLRRLGCSMDWANERFTMDDGMNRAVAKVFVDLYDNKDEAGNPAPLIYRDKRLVNWDPKLKTAISDLEVETVDVQGHFWRFRYPLADGVTLDDGSDHIVVATTRPETMLADMAVAVNAADPRYASVIGEFVTLPITGRRIEIIPDDHADPELGSGAVKITPAHDFNDFEVGKRAGKTRLGFEPVFMLSMFDGDANVVQTHEDDIPPAFLGLHRFRRDGVDGAREAVVAEMKRLCLLVPFIDKDGGEHDAEPRSVATPYGDRSGVVIEPLLTDQWYVDAAILAQPAIKAVRDGGIKIVPKTWEKTWFNWLENIQPWCVSRQLWWGHRIPVWYGPKADGQGRTSPFDKVYYAAYDEEHATQLFVDYYGEFCAEPEITIVESESDANAFWSNVTQVQQNKIAIYQDNDVLDTWFSSALWPFATLGWPTNDSPSPASPQLIEGLSFSSRDGEGKSDASTSSAQAGLGESRALQNPPRNGEVARSDGGAAGGLASSGEDSPEPHPAPPTPAGPPPRSGEDLLSRHYPGDVLISGFDILFFWDARMAMQGLHFMKQVPWKTLYLHGLVRAADGSKMSKSKGNAVDPLGLIDQYGADALRFFMAAMESQGRDIKMDDARLAGYRNFATKLWNAARFCEANGIGASTTLAAPLATLAVNRWIIGEVAETVAAVDSALAAFRFDEAANAVYHFAWDRFCDWYLELIKPVLNPPSPSGEGPGVGTVGQAPLQDDKPHPNPSPEGERLLETKAVAGWVLDQILVMLHPFMPFVTEELWGQLGDRADYPLITAKWPEPGAGIDADAKAQVEWLIKLVSEVRTAKAELGLAPGARLAAHIPASLAPRAAAMASALERVARLSSVSTDPAPAGASAQLVVDGDTITIPLDGIFDIAAEKLRLTKAMDAAVKERDGLAGRLNNPAFVERAKPEAVEKARADHDAKAAEAERLGAALARLG